MTKLFQNICILWFSRSQTRIFPVDVMATPSSPLNSPSPDPQVPNAFKNVPSGLNTWTLLLPLSPTIINPWSSMATPLGNLNCPSFEPATKQ